MKFGSRGLDILSAILKEKYEWPNYSIHLNAMGLFNIPLAVIAGMGASQNPIVTAYLLESLNDQDKIVATAAVRALGELGDRSVADTLLGLYKGESNLQEASNKAIS